ncbi:Hypothetical predicted protein [Mytilus galloprovincialis]|uniref:Ig-like domain-containing protein n=2 Tax=Mytilus galloprovincialis TaxID=29158 RepID=A0A8B6EBY0_MYTGA|nr:Hypothetical predicted protein [Mytilus galloprovincialis]
MYHCRLLKPKISFDKYPFVGERVHFKCNLFKERNNSFTYYYGDEHSRYNYLDVTLSDKGKKVSCQSTNRNGVKSNFSNVLTLDPHYGPEDVKISHTGNVYNVTEHDRLSLMCSAKCYPGCHFSWTDIQGQKTYQGYNLIINKVKRLNGGLYRCHANHTEVTTKTKVKDITINVLYSPKFNSYIKFDVNYTKSKRYTFTEGTLSFTVIINGNPKSCIEMYSSDLNTKTAAQFSSNGIYYSIGLPHMSCENTGNYTLVASNGIGMSSNMTVQLNILCKPKKLLIAPDDTHTELGQEWIVQLSVVSNPKPNVTWVNSTSNLWELIEMKDFRFKFTSVVNASQLSDYGVYGVKICNTIGCITEYVVLQPKGKETIEISETMDYLVYAVSGGGAALFLICIVTCWFCCRKKRQQNKAINEQPKNKAINEQPKNKAINEQHKNKAINEQAKNKATNKQTKNKAIQEQPKIKAIKEQPKIKAINEQPKNKAIVQQPKNKAINQRPKTKATNQQPKNKATNEKPKNKAIYQQPKNIPENGDHEDVEHLYDDISLSYFPSVHYRNSEHEDTNAYTNPGYVNLQQPKQEVDNRHNKNESSARKYVNIK